MRRWSLFWRVIAKIFLRATGWRVEGVDPGIPRYVLVAAPHTSNWDLPYMLAVSIEANVRLSFTIKHQVFKVPLLGWFVGYMGGIPVIRHERHNMIAQLAARFEQSAELALAVQPEGTRKLTPCWKSGFYRIALSAKVPLVLGYLDYATRRGGFGPVYQPTGDVRKDMDELRRFYADKKGLHPELFGPVRLESEAAEPGPSDPVANEASGA